MHENPYNVNLHECESLTHQLAHFFAACGTLFAECHGISYFAITLGSWSGLATRDNIGVDLKLVELDEWNSLTHQLARLFMISVCRRLLERFRKAGGASFA